MRGPLQRHAQRLRRGEARGPGRRPREGGGGPRGPGPAVSPRGSGTMAQVATGRAGPGSRLGGRAHLGDGHLGALPGTAGLTGEAAP